MLRHSLGGAVILFSFQHFIAPALDLMHCLPSQQRREAIKALNLRREQVFSFKDAAVLVILDNKTFF